MVKTWSLIHLEMIKKFKKEKFKQGLKILISTDEYGRLFNSILKFFVPPQNMQAMHQSSALGGILFETEGTLITMCGNVQIDLLVNEIKAKVLLSMKILWEYIVKNKNKDFYTLGNSYMQSAQMFCPVILNTLIYVGTPGRENNTMEQLLQNGHIN